MAQNVAMRTASASAALLGARIFVKVIDLVLMLILARILVPEDFALVAMATIFIQFTEAVLEIPVIQALVRAPTVTDSMLDTAFTISLLRAGLVTLLIVAAAPLAVIIFHEPRLGPLMSLLALSPALRGLINPRLVMYARKLNYFPEASIDVLAKIITTCVAVPIALATKSYWSLAVMTVLTPVTVLIGSYSFAPYRPRFSLKDWPVFADMISWTTVSQIFSAANWQVDIFTLGRNVSSNIVGKYSVSQTLAGAPFQVIVIPIMRPFIAAFSELRTPQAIRPGYLTASAAVVTFVAPILGLVCALTKPIVSLLFSDAWAGATLFLTTLSITYLIALPSQASTSVVLALNRARYNALQAAITFVIKAPLLMAGLALFGISGFLTAQILGMIASSLCAMLIVKHLLGLPLLAQIQAILRPYLALGVLIGAALALGRFIEYSNPVLLVLSTGAVALAAMVAYWAALFLIWWASGRPAGVESYINSSLAAVAKRLSASKA